MNVQAALSGMNSRLSSMTSSSIVSDSTKLLSNSNQNKSTSTAYISILDRPIHRLRNLDVSLSAFAYLFSELVQSSHKSAKGVSDLERMLNSIGYRIGQRYLDLLVLRDKGHKRDIRLLPLLLFINTFVWKALFGKSADSLEKSSENQDEYMISDNDLLVNRFISIPKELSQLNTGAFVAGIIEAILDGSGFPARTTAHTVPIDGYPFRTTILMKFDPKVLEREEQLEKAK